MSPTTKKPVKPPEFKIKEEQIVLVAENQKICRAEVWTYDKSTYKCALLVDPDADSTFSTLLFRDDDDGIYPICKLFEILYG